MHLVSAPQHWCRHVMNREVANLISRLNPQTLDVLEISGDAWAKFGFRSFRSVHWPDFDICSDRLSQRFDLIIAEQVFEHIYDPDKAARNVRSMLRPSGRFLVTLPFLIKFHPFPRDYRRWTIQGLEAFLAINHFTDIHVDAWGNKECLIANLDTWVDYDPSAHSLENDRRYPVSVWALARRGDHDTVRGVVRRIRRGLSKRVWGGGT